MQIIDRDYQVEAVKSLWDYFRIKSGNPVVAMPTGTGKSIVIARFLQSVYAYYPNQKVMILTHVKELIQQNYEKLMMVWQFAPAGIYSAGLNQKVHNRQITFAGIASVAKKPSLFGHIDLVLIDEAHLVSPSEATMYQAFIGALRAMNPFLKVIGLTATPWRLGHGHITEPVVNSNGSETPSIFTDVCFDITGVLPFNRLISEGYLLPLVPRRTVVKLDVDNVHMRGGEYIESELQQAVDKDETTMAALREAMELGHDRRKWLIFASGTDHADHIADMLNMLGIETGCVHSKREGRDSAIADFKAGKLRALVNNNVLTTGFDEPGIDMIVVLRPTASAVLWVQMLGRGTRPFYVNPMIGHNGGPTFDLNTTEGRLACIAASPKQNCLVLDYAQNTKRLGPVNDPVIPKRKGEKGGEAPVKECPVCHCYCHTSVRICEGLLSSGDTCGHEFKFENKLKDQAGSDQLIRGDFPVMEIFAVDHVVAKKHIKIGSPPMVKLSYYCGRRIFSEYVCPEHDKYALRRAHLWWKERSRDPVPTSTDVLLGLLKTLPVATHLRVWTNKQYPEIMATCLDGTAFGATERSDYDEGPSIELEIDRSPIAGYVASLKGPTDSSLPIVNDYQVIDDDDIPF
jgi:DNA repair protein RadD